MSFFLQLWLDFHTVCTSSLSKGYDLSYFLFSSDQQAFSAGNKFSLFTGHMSFQIFILVGHLTNWTGHNLLTDNTLKKITQDVLVRCSVIVSDHNVKLVGQRQMTDCYFQHWALDQTLCKVKKFSPSDAELPYM